MREQLFVIQAAIILVGLLVQIIRFDRGRLSIMAPVFYVAGVTLILFGPLSGLSGFVMAWLLSPVFPKTQGFLCIQACAGLTISILIHGVQLVDLIAFTVCVLPVIISLLAQRPLLVPTRRSMAPTRDVTP